MKTLIITGKRHTGKSSLLNQTFMLDGLNFYGIRSMRTYDDQLKEVGFDISTIKENKVQEKNILMRRENGLFQVNTNFSTYAKFIDQSIKDKPDMFFIDEIGRVEEDDLAYRNAIIRLIGSDIPTILILKKEDSTLFRDICSLVDGDEVSFLDLDKKRYRPEEIINYDHGKDIITYDPESIDVFGQVELADPKSGLCFYESENLNEVKRAVDLGYIGRRKVLTYDEFFI